MKNSENPKARSENLIIQELQEETLVYDLRTNEAHCLNKTAAFVWKNCDGKNSVTEIASLLEKSFGNLIADDFVILAITQLGERDLLSEKTTNYFSRSSRREMIKKIGLASMIALPIVSSLTVPVSAIAVSCGCVNPGQCITQTSCPSTVNCNGAGVCAP